MVSPEALIFQASPVFTAVAVLVHFIVPMPRSSASTARSCVQVLPSLHFGSPCGVTFTVLGDERGVDVVEPLAEDRRVVGQRRRPRPACRPAPRPSTQAAANCLTTSADACFSSFGSGFAVRCRPCCRNNRR